MAQRDFVGTAVINAINALEVDVHGKPAMAEQRRKCWETARDDFEAAHEYAAADMVSDILARKAYASEVEPVITTMIRKYGLHFPEWMAAHA